MFKEASRTLLQILAGFGAASLCAEPVKIRLPALKFMHSHTLKVFMLLYADGVFAILYKHERVRVALIHSEDLLRSTVVLSRQPGHITHASRGDATMDFVLLFSSEGSSKDVGLRPGSV